MDRGNEEGASVGTSQIPGQTRGGGRIRPRGKTGGLRRESRGSTDRGTVERAHQQFLVSQGHISAHAVQNTSRVANQRPAPIVTLACTWGTTYPERPHWTADTPRTGRVCLSSGVVGGRPLTGPTLAKVIEIGVIMTWQ